MFNLLGPGIRRVDFIKFVTTPFSKMEILTTINGLSFFSDQPHSRSPKSSFDGHLEVVCLASKIVRTAPMVEL